MTQWQINWNPSSSPKYNTKMSKMRELFSLLFTWIHKRTPLNKQAYFVSLHYIYAVWYTNISANIKRHYLFLRGRERDSEYKKGRGVTLQEKKIERGMAGGNYSEYIFCEREWDDNRLYLMSIHQEDFPWFLFYFFATKICNLLLRSHIKKTEVTFWH